MLKVHRLVVIGSCSLALLPLALYVYHKQKNSGIQVKTNCETNNGVKKTNFSNLKDFKKEKLTSDVARSLNMLLTSNDSEIKRDVLVMLQQASAFSSNFVVIRDSDCLDSMLALLDANDSSPIVKRQNLCILQTTTNLVCDILNLQVVQRFLDTIFSIANTMEYSDQACAALQLLCNAALTPTGCRMLNTYIPALYDMLQTKDPYMLRQVFSMLVNLSCDPESRGLLLQSKIPLHLRETLAYCLSSAIQPLVTIQLVNFLKNVYPQVESVCPSVIGDSSLQSGPLSLADFLRLQQTQTTLKLRLQLLLSEPATNELVVELRRQMEALYIILDHFHTAPNERPAV
ncbi:hypothetical protein PHET_03843 [Paragonimus heterotremus]|uniref:Armadillo repeat-containing domain-containing protein n=1 Tax=Paragonimus heterotremus TaxID=100268 RepID=A0A8J4SNZ9_9TREM|nr:hypothetical protein PHET_03843 [Paragonimus heterotremus]